MKVMEVASSKKGPKTPKKHDKQKWHINVFPKGVLMKSSSTHETRSSHIDSRSSCECTSDFMGDSSGNECMHIFADVRGDEC